MAFRDLISYLHASAVNALPAELSSPRLAHLTVERQHLAITTKEQSLKPIHSQQHLPETPFWQMPPGEMGAMPSSDDFQSLRIFGTPMPKRLLLAHSGLLCKAQEQQSSAHSLSWVSGSLWVMSASGWKLKQLSALHSARLSKHSPALSSWERGPWMKAVSPSTKTTFMPSAMEIVKPCSSPNMKPTAQLFFLFPGPSWWDFFFFLNKRQSRVKQET